MIADANPITVLQLSDLHLFAQPDQQLLGLNTTRTLELVLDAVKALPQSPDIVLLTGDLAQDESAEAYQYLRAQLSDFSMPIYAIPGNHDDPVLIQSILSQPPFHPERTVSMGGWQIILLDSSVEGEVHGYLSPEVLGELKQTLSLVNQPTLIALHHPAYAVKSRWLDEIGLQNREEFWSVLDDYSHVKIVLCGHIHQDMPFVRHGVQYWSTPSTCFQFKPKSKTFAADLAAPGFRLLTLWPNASFQSWIQRVPISQSVNVSSPGY